MSIQNNISQVANMSCYTSETGHVSPQNCSGQVPNYQMGLTESLKKTNISVDTIPIFGWIPVLSAFLLVFGLYLLVSFVRSFLRVDSITSRYVLITGCDSGFGRTLAKKLDRQGVPVFAACLTTEGSRALSEESSSRLKTILLDITNEQSVNDAFDFVFDQLPANRGLWGLVNNAGVMPTYCPSEMLEKKDFEAVCNVNLFGTISMTLKFLPLIRQAKGRIVNVSSIVSAAGLPGVTNYCVSKAAVKSFTTCLRREIQRAGVTVLSVEPGGFATDVTAKSRLKTLLLRAFKAANKEVQEFYGGNIFRFIYLGFEIPSTMTRNLNYVANAMEHGLFAKYPKLSYVVGYDAVLFFKPISKFPEWVADTVFCWPKPYGQMYHKIKNDLDSGLYD